MARIKLHSEVVGLGRERLQARLAALAAQFPGAEIKTRRLPRYGNGYTISVHGEGEAKSVQLRGHCQFCGNHQVIKDGVLVLHGYQRPGHGWIYGRCPGMEKLALQKDQSLTEAFLAEAESRRDRLQKAQPALEAEERGAKAIYDRDEPHMVYGQPHKPYLRFRATDEEKALAEQAHQAALAAWFAAHPATKAYLDAMDAVRANKQAIFQAESHVKHFETLLGWKLLGTPYKEVAKG
jgi:hypothetical protein